MRPIILLLSFSGLICSCHHGKTADKEQEKFDKVKWAIKKDKSYPFRDKMLNDAITNHILHGLKKDEVVNLLGPPNRIDSNYLFYTVDQQLLANVFPLHTKTLVIKLSADTVEWRKIHD